MEAEAGRGGLAPPRSPRAPVLVHEAGKSCPCDCDCAMAAEAATIGVAAAAPVNTDADAEAAILGAAGAGRCSGSKLVDTERPSSPARDGGA